jgi:hypothetical protein
VSVAAVAITVLATGLKPQKMWGIHMLLFLPLWLAWRIARARPQGALALRAATAGTVLTAAIMVFAVHATRNVGLHSRLHSPDRLVPATQLAKAALADWRAATNCPLRLVTGNSFPAGLVSVYSGLYPEVLEDGDFGKSPWITSQQLHDWGALELHGPVPLPQVPAGVPAIPTPGPRKFGDVPAAIWWRVIPPSSACGP